MTTESYTVIIRGGTGAIGRVSGDSTDGVYRVDWEAVLPKKYQKFRLRTSFRTNFNLVTNVTNEPLVYIECSAFSKTGFLDSIQRNRGNVISICEVEFIGNIGGTDRFRIKSFTDERPIMVGYPSENQFNIQLRNHTSVIRPAGDFAVWVLVLNFEPILNP